MAPQRRWTIDREASKVRHIVTKQSIAIVGSGAVGQFYGAQFIQAGHDVRFLARRDAHVLASRGLVVQQTPVREVSTTTTHPVLRFEPDRFRVDTDPARLSLPAAPDWVLVALKATALPSAQDLMSPLVGPNTNVVVLANGLGIEDQLARWCDPDRVFGLLCFVGVNRDDDGTIRHVAFGNVSAGHFLDRAARRSALAALCRGAGIRCVELESLLEARWRKLAWNIPFNGLCVLHDTTTDGIVGVPELRAEARSLAEETVAIGNADLQEHGRAGLIEPAWVDRQIRLTDTMGAYAPSTLLDARAGRPIEYDVLFAEPFRRALRLGMTVPALGRLTAALQARPALRGE